MKYILIVGVCALLTSCLITKTNYYINPNSKIDTLSICINYSEKIDLEVQKSFESAISDDIIRFNHENHKFKLSTCRDSTFRSLNINVMETTFVNSKSRLASTLITLAGAGVTFLMYYTNSPLVITFWYVPETKSETYFRLSDDLTYNQKSNIIKPSNRAMFLNQKKQIEKHRLTFVRFFRNELKSLESQYSKNSKLKY
jgi:hypothetical protein